MVKMPKEVMDALAEEHALKMVATVSSKKVPNAVIIATVSPFDENTVGFADLKLGKTRQNMEETKKFTVTVFKPNLESYQIKCSFTGFLERGDLAYQMGEAVYKRVRFNPRAFATGKVEEVYSTSLGNPGEKLA